MISLGTFNTLDGKGTVTDFADVILVTEGIASKVRAQIGDTHDVFVCGKQKDLVIAVRKGLLFNAADRYEKALFGAKKVSPHRGTFWVTGRIHGERVALVVEHRVNAAFPPFKRGEALFRRLAWWSHTRMTLRIIRRLKKRGFTVHGGGDLNTPAGVKGYRGVLNEVGGGLDRLGSTKRLTDVQHLSRMGSDHPRLRAMAD